MPTLMLTYRVAEEGVAEVVDAITDTVAELAAAGPEGVRYAYLRAAGGTEFVALLTLEEGVENPLPGLPAGQRLQAAVAKWSVDGPPAPRPFDVLGAHRLFG
ncbi:hypothetical protein [Streptomyces marincola]|uniref:Monooxygenase n=1 Tax=Streptomyces marincola TaxID=2878388 RepID=A0A1W7D381_9ACTN|nr:hypothetical protein [Streptomyces marincola]ARQ71482.1 hypothetical protein CAG99_23995 [Streptomyces marincola]UCM87114.1 hypothetical protein LC193_03680 [Streptomyces marincola]